MLSHFNLLFNIILLKKRLSLLVNGCNKAWPWYGEVRVDIKLVEPKEQLKKRKETDFLNQAKTETEHHR